LLTLFSVAVLADPSLLEKARALQAGGKAPEAYQMLQAQSDKYAGNPDYDYLLGTIAIDAGVPLQAVFALERVLDIQPGNAAARAELARAYFLIGENQAARAEFEQAKKAEMPAEARVEIGSYLSSIDERILGGKQRTLGYLEAGLGFDSNVNSATASSQITAPNGLLYDVNAPEKNSPVARLEGGGSFSYALETNLNVYGNGKLELYRPSDASEYATRNTEGTVGLHFLRGREQYRFALVAQNYAVDSTTTRNLSGINGQWQHTIDARNMLSLFAQFASLKYPEASVLDADQLAMGLSWIHALAGKYQPVAYLTGFSIQVCRPGLFWDACGVFA
jgi:tetratricopeptide (TPR) repeat protein